MNSGSGDGKSSPLHSLIESKSILRRQFKITGQTGDPDEKDKLNYSSLYKQIETDVEQKYKEHDIVDGVLSYLEFFKDLSLDRLKKILRSHYRTKNIVDCARV